MSRYRWCIDDQHILRDGEPMSSDEVMAALKERDALAAHVARLMEADSAAEALRAVAEIRQNKAAACSLRRIKAQWQAEALERHAEGIARDNDPTDMVCVEDIHTLLLHEAAELRRN